MSLNKRKKLATYNDDFERWERVSIEFDIAIDEQDEKRCEKIVKCAHDDLSWIFTLQYRDSLDKAEELLNGSDARIISNGGADISVEIIKRGQDFHQKYKFWTAFFLAKKLRAKLQSTNDDKQLKKLDWVVDILIKKASSAIFNKDDTFQYLLLMLELTACTTGEQSLGFSEKAREILNSDQIKKLSASKRRAYKALIHYNQGVAKAHMNQPHDALKEYNKAIQEFEDNGIDINSCAIMFITLRSSRKPMCFPKCSFLLMV